jgi:hypothetical protein
MFHIRAPGEVGNCRIDLRGMRRRQIAADQPRAGVVHPVAGARPLLIHLGAAQRHQGDDVTIGEFLRGFGTNDQVALNQHDGGLLTGAFKYDAQPWCDSCVP